MIIDLVTALLVLGTVLVLVAAWPLPPRRFLAVGAGVGLLGTAVAVLGFHLEAELAAAGIVP